MHRLLVSIFAMAFAAGCAGGAPPPAKSPESSDTALSRNEVEATRPADAKPAPPPLKVPDPPAACREYVERTAKDCKAGNVRELLADAVTTTDASARDQKLVCLEADEALAPGIVRALRADLAQETCADAIVTPYLEANDKLGAEVQQTLIGLMLAGKLARLGAEPPALQGSFDKQQFLQFFEEKLKPWILGQAAAIGDLSLQGSRLNDGYGKAVAALAAGSADLRFVDLAREIPLPEEMKSDREVRDVYYATLDEALEPRKQRGRDAALVGLRLFAQLGVLHDARVNRARALISKLYSGARVDALDGLLLPTLPPAKLETTAQKLAAGLPTYYALALLTDLDPAEPATLRALLDRGLPPPLRKKLDQPKLDPKASKLYARALVDSGVLYFRAADFKHAAELLGQNPGDDESKLLRALSRSLEAGPADAAELMGKGFPVSGLGSQDELDALAKSKAKTAGMAAFNGAYVLELVPRRDDPTFWEDMAGRYERASKLLTDPAQKKRASEYSNAAKATAKAVSAARPPAGKS